MTSLWSKLLPPQNPQGSVSDKSETNLLEQFLEKYCLFFHFPLQKFFDRLEMKSIFVRVELVAIEHHTTSVGNRVCLAQNKMFLRRSMWRTCCIFEKTCCMKLLTYILLQHSGFSLSCTTLQFVDRLVCCLQQVSKRPAEERVVQYDRTPSQSKKICPTSRSFQENPCIISTCSCHRSTIGGCVKIE